jgi:hypothetical protein
MLRRELSAGFPFVLLVLSIQIIGCGGSLNSLAGLAELRSGCAMRSSSADPNWQNGNRDARPIAPRETLVVGELEGPGIIQHIWFTIAAGDKFFPRTTVLRIYWDGNEEPSVEAPLGDFFAVGHGLVRTVDSVPVQVSSNGRAYNCYWPMPFRRSARITMTNDSEQRVRALFWYIDWVKVQRLPGDLGYFHAQYRQEYPCQSGQDYLILDTKGKGHYVGTVLSVQASQPSWFGEGDDRFFVDGEEEPSLRGTGTEDYFCDAWGFREFNHGFYGVTLWEGFRVGDRGTAYRWHIADPVPFQRSLQVTIEHKGVAFDSTGKMRTGFGERADYFSSVAFWYQSRPAKRFTTMPPADERVFPEMTVEAEDFIEQGSFHPAGAEMIQELGNCSGGKQILFTSSVPDATVELPLEIPASGEFLLSLDLVHSWDYGIYDVFLDGEKVLSELDLYSPSVIKESHRIGVRDVEAGEHRLVFTCVGANPKSALLNGSGPGYYLGIDALTLRRLNLTRPQE